MHNAQDNRVDKANASHCHQTKQKQVGISVQLKVCGLRVQDGTNQLALGSTEPWAKESIMLQAWDNMHYSACTLVHCYRAILLQFKKFCLIKFLRCHQNR